LLTANGQEGQAGTAAQPLQGFDVFIGGDRALREGDAAARQEAAA
jgi:hypothetical protein